MSEAPPRPSVNPSSVVLNAPGRTITTALEIVNRGGGRLQATLDSDVPWLVVEPRVIDDNRQRVAITVEAAMLPEDEESTGRITLRWGRLALEVPVRVTRYGLRRAWALYEEGKRDEARELARAVSETSGAADGPLLLATSFLDEEKVAPAIRPLADVTAALNTPDGRSGLDGAHARPAMQRFLAAVTRTLPQMRDARYCVPTLDALLMGGTAARLGLEAETRSLLHDAAARFVDAFPPSAMGDADVDTSRRLVERMQHEFPDEPQWHAWLAGLQAREAAPARLTEPPVRQTSTKTRLLIAAVVVAIVAALVVLMVRPRVRVREAQAMLDAGRFEEALAVVVGAGEDGLESADLRAMRSRIHGEWSKTLFNGGEYKKGAAQLSLALVDDRNNPDLLAFKRTAYKRWADAALAGGRVTEAYEALNELSTMKPPEPDAARKLEEIRPMWRIFTVLGEIAARGHNGRLGTDAPSVPIDVEHLRERDEWGRFLRQQGVAWYDRRIQIDVVRLFGDDREQLFIAGTDAKGGSGFKLYAPRLTSKPQLEPISTYAAPPGLLLDRMQGVRLRDAPRQTGLVVDFVQPDAPQQGRGVLLWGQDGSVRQWTPPDCTSPLEVREGAEDAGLLLVARNGGRSVAFRWGPAGPVASPAGP